MVINKDSEQEIKSNSKRLWGCLIGLALVFVPIIYFIGMFSYVMNYKEIDLVVSHSPNNENTIKVVEIGEPFFFGPSSIRLKYKNEKFDTSISNDGKTLDVTNVEVDWINNEEATIVLDGEEQLPEVIKFEVTESQPPSFIVEHIELGYIATYAETNPFGDYEIQIRKSTYSKGSENQYDFDAPVRIYYGPKGSELQQYEEWRINKFSARDHFKLSWNDGYVLIDVLGENDNGTTYVKDSLKISFN